MIILLEIHLSDPYGIFNPTLWDIFTIFRLPIDTNNCSSTDLVRVRHLRTPRGKTDKDQDDLAGVSFDPRKYLKKKKQ